MRELVAQYLSQSISRRTFIKRLTTAGVSAAAAHSVLEPCRAWERPSDHVPLICEIEV